MYDDIIPVLSSAIDKLSSIKMPEEDKETIAENVATIKNEKIGRFIVELRKLEERICVLSGYNSKMPKPINQMIGTLKEIGTLEQNDFMEIKRILHFRNGLVHGNSSIDMSDEKIEEIINSIITIRNKLEELEDNDDSK